MALVTSFCPWMCDWFQVRGKVSIVDKQGKRHLSSSGLKQHYWFYSHILSLRHKRNECFKMLSDSIWVSLCCFMTEISFIPSPNMKRAVRWYWQLHQCNRLVHSWKVSDSSSSRNLLDRIGQGIFRARESYMQILLLPMGTCCVVCTPLLTVKTHFCLHLSVAMVYGQVHCETREEILKPRLVDSFYTGPHRRLWCHSFSN